MRRLTVLFLLVLSVLTVYAETEKGAQITGKVIDASTKQGMEFANISLRKTGSKEFDYTKLNNATSEKEYSELLKQAERELLEKTIFDRKIYGKNT
jgi:negative regulator of sigma E activity